jgi:putative transposase
MAESFVKTMKRDYISFMPKSDGDDGGTQPDHRPRAVQKEAIHSALNYRSPREYRRIAASFTSV